MSKFRNWILKINQLERQNKIYVVNIFNQIFWSTAISRHESTDSWKSTISFLLRPKFMFGNDIRNFRLVNFELYRLLESDSANQLFYWLVNTVAKSNFALFNFVNAVQYDLTFSVYLVLVAQIKWLDLYIQIRKD